MDQGLCYSKSANHNHWVGAPAADWFLSEISQLRLAWGNSVSALFRERVAAIGLRLAIDPSSLMTCMAFESGHTFSPNIRNAAGSGATGLIQFMPSTAGLLGTTTDALAHMTAEGQLDFVEKYFAPFRGRLKNLGDTYLAILWPAGIGKADDWVMFTKGGHRPALYLQNRGLDIDHDGEVTRGEVCRRIYAEHDAGMKPPHVWDGDL
jgi:hypothetical protein